MKEKILALLIAKFEGVSEQILSRIANNMAKTVTTDEDSTTAVEGVTLQSIIDSQADYRANDATIKAVSNYEKKHGLNNGQKANGGEPTNTEPKGGEDDTPVWAQNLINSNKTLSDKVTAMEGEKQSEQFSSILKNKCKDIDEAFYNVATNGRTFNSEEEVDAYAESLNTDWGAYSQKLANNGLSRMSQPSGGASPKEGAEEIASIINAGTKKIEN